jgi:hypothetical protein
MKYQQGVPVEVPIFVRMSAITSIAANAVRNWLNTNAGCVAVPDSVNASKTLCAVRTQALKKQSKLKTREGWVYGKSNS